MAERWTIPIGDYLDAMRKAVANGDTAQERHLLTDFWICDGYAIPKRERTEPATVRATFANGKDLETVLAEYARRYPRSSTASVAQWLRERGIAPVER